MSYRNISKLSNSMVPDNAKHFSLNLALAVDKVYQRISKSGKYLMLLKFNVYSRFTISCQLSNLLELPS